MAKPKKNKLFFRILAILFLMFISLNIAYESGYYQTKAQSKTILTKEAMQEFEEDVKEGKVVDIKNYLPKDDIDYSNNVTKLGNKLSNGLSNFMTKGIAKIFDTLKGLFWN